MRKGSRKCRHSSPVRLSRKPYYARAGIALYHADSLAVAAEIPAGVAAAVITDPPYCSGGTTAAERSADPITKYCQNNITCGRPSFEGESRDQRSYAFWCTLWLSECRRLLQRSGYCLVFSDWRQLPTITDVVQAGGLTWRGIIPWNKGRGARAPHKGFFRHQCEYVVWSTNGKVPKATHGGPFDGWIEEKVRQADKFHMTGKPTRLMEQLVACVPPGGLVLDLFGGSGTTAVACARTGRRCLAVEQSGEYCAIAARRIEEALEDRRKAA